MEAKKSKKAAIENQRGSWLMMGLIVALAFMFVSFEWTQHDVRVALISSADDPIFVTELVPITFPDEKKLEPPPPAVKSVTDLFTIVDDDIDVDEDVSIVADDMTYNKPVEGVFVPPVGIVETVVEDEIYVAAENMPEFPGGTDQLMKYLASHIKYPTISQEMGTDGRVIVQFVVDKNGSITSPEVVRSVDPYLDKEALRVISTMPKWKPGEQNGKKVRVKFTVPVTFKLQ
ncbi:energy transducer TonB [Bacteroides sp.]|uniref:energy transducer TonB n=1 Tax=Bacteroides sp. TaxID=29523 RepID=UPI00262F5E46|nr:energy transducer TonB [Bacteroides sp.]MDD3040210.1 energy transducer TonB [Bacteroides sp.]